MKREEVSKLRFRNYNVLAQKAYNHVMLKFRRNLTSSSLMLRRILRLCLDSRRKSIVINYQCVAWTWEQPDIDAKPDRV